MKSSKVKILKCFHKLNLVFYSLLEAALVELFRVGFYNPSFVNFLFVYNLALLLSYYFGNLCLFKIEVVKQYSR